MGKRTLPYVVRFVLDVILRYEGSVTASMRLRSNRFGIGTDPSYLRMTSSAVPPTPLLLCVSNHDLFRIVDSASFTDDRHFDLARILHLLFDAARRVAGQLDRGQVIDLLGPDDQTQLAPGLYGECAIDSRI